MNIVEIAPEALSQYGKSLIHPLRKPHNFLIGSTYWGQVSLSSLSCGAEVSLLRSKVAATEISIMEKHIKSDEIVLVTRGSARVALALGADEPDSTTMQIFQLKAGDAYLMRAGVFHSGFMLASSSEFEAVLVLNKGTVEEDCSFVKLPVSVAVGE